MKLTPPHGPLRYPKNSNYTVLRELIEETHNWRQKKNRGTLQLFSHTSCYFVDLDAQENIRLVMGWYAYHEEPSGSNNWVRDKERTETVLWTLDANNVYTLQLPTESYKRNFTYVTSMYRASPFFVSNRTIHGVHQVQLHVRNQRPTYRYEQGLRVTRTGDVLGGVLFKAPIVDRAKAKQYQFLGRWFKDAKAMSQFDTRTIGEHADALKAIVERQWMLEDVAGRIVADPAETFELFYLALMARRYVPWRFIRIGNTVLNDSASSQDQLISPYRMLRERILQQAGVYILPYEV